MSNGVIWKLRNGSCYYFEERKDAEKMAAFLSQLGADKPEVDYVFLTTFDEAVAEASKIGDNEAIRIIRGEKRGGA